jgi:two-component system, response regulator PdtaR
MTLGLERRTNSTGFSMSRVLVVEDEPLIRMNAVDMIADAGSVAVEAANADEAIRILESRTDIDVVFSDVNMPGSMDGLRLLQLIHNRWPPIRLILVSGKELEAGTILPEGSVFIPKPYDLAGLSMALAIID